MLGAIGAMTKYAPPLITVDCGTAVTVNAISQDRHFLGGVIFAGLSTQLFGLSKQTAAIQEMKFSPATTFVGVNTTQCLMAGVTYSVAGGIQQAVDVFSKQLQFKDPLVILTGGEAASIVEFLQSRGMKTHQEPHLVTDGILSLVANATEVDLHDSVIKKIT
jgi:type III pantothenate kinase